MTVAVIIQARMTSTRLPGKVLYPLSGISVLEHVLTRCQAIAGVDLVCCAVPSSSDSIPIVAECKRLGVQIFQGAENDVLDRYYRAAQELEADFILRVTADCPLIDPEVCSDVLKLVCGGGVAFACNNMPPSWPHGLDCEALTFECLELAATEADKDHEREHVTPWIRNNAKIKKANLVGPGNGSESHRWTIDYQNDYEFLKAIWERLPIGREGWKYKVPLRIVKTDPSLVAINAK